MPRLVGVMTPRSAAMSETGAAQLLAERLVTAVGDAGPTALPAGLFMLTAVFGCPDSRHQETTS